MSAPIAFGCSVSSRPLNEPSSKSLCMTHICLWVAILPTVLQTFSYEACDRVASIADFVRWLFWGVALHLSALELSRNTLVQRVAIASCSYQLNANELQSNRLTLNLRPLVDDLIQRPHLIFPCPLVLPFEPRLILGLGPLVPSLRICMCHPCFVRG